MDGNMGKSNKKEIVQMWRKIDDAMGRYRVCNYSHSIHHLDIYFVGRIARSVILRMFYKGE